MSDSYVNFGSSALPGEPQTVGQGTGERRGRGAMILLPGNAPNATALKPGDIIPGTVASLGADGRLRVDTAHGPVFLDRSTGLKTGAQIQLQVVATGAQPELKLLAQAPESPLPPPRAEAPALRPGADLVVRLAPQQDVPGRATGHGQLSHALGALIDKLGGALRNAPPDRPDAARTGGTRGAVEGPGGGRRHRTGGRARRSARRRRHPARAGARAAGRTHDRARRSPRRRRHPSRARARPAGRTHR